MALIHCPDCQREVSSRAIACPGCAYPIQSLTNFFDAIEQNDVQMIRDLLQAGLKPNQKNEAGLTPLKLAINQGKDRIIPLLEEVAEPTVRIEKVITNPVKDSRPKVIAATPVLPNRKPTNENQEPKKIPDTPAIAAVVQPPPIPEISSSPRPVGVIDDLAPEKVDAKYNGPGLICKTCEAQIALEDIWCPSCKAPIVKRYCGGCRELIPENVASCPLCQSTKTHRFRYFRNLEQMVAGGAVLALLISIFGLYSANDADSYAKKMAQVRSEQQQEKDIAVEEASQKRLASKNLARPTQPAVIREISPHKNKAEVVKAKGIAIPLKEIPAPERDKTMQESEQDTTQSIPEKSLEEELKTAEGTENQMEQFASRLNSQGFELMKDGRYTEAIPILAQAVRTFPPGKKSLNYAYSLYNLGRSLRLAGRPDLAIPILEERLKFSDQHQIVAEELEQARRELYGSEQFNDVQFE